MKYLYIATFFALLLSFVSAKGIYCTRHIIIKHGDRCRQIYGYGEKKQYYVRFKDLMIMNPSKFNFLITSIYILLYYI